MAFYFSAQVAIEPRSGTAARGQVAMEYLVTYGWALLALVAVLGILFASGLFSASNFATQECVFQPDLPCNTFIFYQSTSNPSTSSTLEFRVTNGLGYPINITEITYTATDLGTSGRTSNTFSIPTSVPSGVSKDFKYVVNGPAQPSIGNVVSILVSLTYKNCKYSPCTGPYNTTGRITATVQPAP
jgi:hypothetical protein